jgi:hypothetical protein
MCDSSGTTVLTQTQGWAAAGERSITRHLPCGRAVRLSSLAFAAIVLAACSTPTTPPGGIAAQAQSSPASPVVHGIRVQALHLSAAGSMLDFRYRVVDPVEAAPLLNGKIKVYLVDEARGAKLGVPNSPVLGSIRQTARNQYIATDHTYFIMFGNPGKAVRSGDTVTLLVGDQKFTDVRVQ